MTNDVQIFKHEMFGEVRVVQKDGKPYFVGKDVAKALGYADTDQAIRTHCKYPTNQRVGVNTGCMRNDGTFIYQNKDMKIIPDSDLYRLIMRSQLESAEKFQDWVMEDILPTIARTGGYVSNEDMFINIYLHDAPEDIKNKFKAVTAVVKDLNNEVKQLNGKITEDKPKVIFAESIEKATTGIMVADMAKILKQNGVEIGQHRLFQWLRQKGLCVKTGNSQNMPTQYAMQLGLMMILEKTSHNKQGSLVITKIPMITGKGQIYIVNKFIKQKAE